MYVELLSQILDNDNDTELPPEDDLLDVALGYRSRTLETPWPGRVTVHQALANEIAYDRALIRLCTASGIEAAPSDFGHPRVARDRLERELARAGIDLAAHAGRQIKGG